MTGLQASAALVARRTAWSLLYAAALSGAGFSVDARAADPATLTQTGRVQGSFKDAQGKAMANAGVEIKQGDTLAARIRTDNAGAFSASDLAPGDYRVTATDADGETAAAPLSVEAGKTASLALSLDAQVIQEVTVVGQRFEHARNSLSPSTGGSEFQFDHKSIESLPQGDNTPFNQVLLQAPGVTNDSYGQFHIRNDHNNLQYRINGVILPEGLSGFGQTIDTRFADKVALLTGALPAQYGDRTAAVVDITTKQHFDSGDVGIYGGSHDLIEPSFQYGKTTAGGTSAYVTGSFMNSGVGIESPTDAYEPIHDRTTQGKGFGYLSFYASDSIKLSGIFGTAVSRFEIPNTPGLAVDPAYGPAEGVDSFDSSLLNDRQFERSNYGLVAMQGLLPHDGSYQLAVFDRVSSVEYEPDVVGDLAFNGDASRIKRKASTVGLQGDLSLPFGDSHTFRSGFSVQTEDDRSDNSSAVFNTTTDAEGNVSVIPGPVTILDNNPKNGLGLYALYMQDEWKLADSLTVNYGLRYDVLRAYVSAQQLSPRLGVVWNATSTTAVHAAYARYFTPPPNEEVASSSITKFANTTNAPEITQNSPVQAQRDHYFDVGFTQQITPSLSFGLDSYYRYSRQLIDEGQFGQALIFTAFNYDQGRLWGVEATTAYHQGPWNAYLNLSRGQEQAQRITSGEYNFGADELAYIADHSVYTDHSQRVSASGGLSYLYRGTTLGLDAIYGDGLRRGFANTDKLNPYTQVDLSASHTVHAGPLGALDLRGSVLNVLDRQYELRDGSGIGVGAAQYGPRVGVYFGITKPFKT